MSPCNPKDTPRDRVSAILRLVAYLLIGVMLLIALPQAVAEEWQGQPLKGEWKVHYWDARLGIVTGRALVTEDGSTATVELRHPESGEINTLRSVSLSRQGDQISIIFEGRSPRSGQRDGLHYPDRSIVVPEAAESVSVRYEADESELLIKPLQETDSERVTIRLWDRGDGVLAGEWLYQAHPFIGRDHTGYGRAGHVKEVEGIGFAIGDEVWSRPRPLIYGVIPIQDQLGQDRFSDGTQMAKYPYPFGGVGDGLKHRTLFVFGRDLPLDSKTPVRIKAESDDDLSYSFVSYRSDAERNPAYKEMFRIGLNKLLAGLEEGQRAAAREYDSILIRATQKPETVPGYQQFSINGAPGVWLLQYGDNGAQVRFVRFLKSHRNEPSGDLFEETNRLYTREIFQVEVRTQQRLNVDSLRVLVGRNGRPLQIEDGYGIPLYRVKGKPRTYRSLPIYLDRSLEPDKVLGDRYGRLYWYRMGIRPGDRMFAKIAEPGLISIEPTIATAEVFHSPQAMNARWRDYLERAADCHGIASADLERLSYRNAEKISTFLINTGRHPIATPGWMEARVQVGHHAAMIYLRDAFIGMMEANRYALGMLRTDHEFIAYRRYIEPLVHHQDSPFSRVRVTDPGGAAVNFAATFDAYSMMDFYHLDVPQTERWVLQATREAVAKYRLLMQQAIKRAKETDSCNPEELLKLTGYRFEAVAAFAKTMLMRPGPPGSGIFWTPDFHARAWIDNVSLLGETVAVHEQLSEAAWDEFQMAVGLASLPVSVYGSFAKGGLAVATMVASFAIDVIDISSTMVSEIGAHFKRTSEVKFALGSADVLGLGRLRIAEERDKAWTYAASRIFINLMMSSAGGIDEYVEVPQAAWKWGKALYLKRLDRGRGIARRMVEESGTAIPSVSTMADGRKSAPDTGSLRQVMEAIARRADHPPDETLIEPVPEVSDHPVDMPSQRGSGSGQIERMTDGERLELLAFLLEARRVHTTPGAIKTRLQEEALIAFNRQSDIEAMTGVKQPSWAKRIAETTFQELRHLLHRPDLHELMKDGAEIVEKELRTGGKRARLARELIEFEPGLTPERFTELLEKRLARQTDPKGRNYYDQADPSDEEIIELLHARGWRVNAEGPNPYTGAMEIFITDPKGNMGFVERSFDAKKGILTLDQAFRRGQQSPAPIASHIKDVGRVELDEKGIPAIPFFTYRAMKHFGIEFAGKEGIVLKQVKLSAICNLQTVAKLEWIRGTYFPGRTIDEIQEAGELSRLLMHTPTVQYAESILTQAGYRIKSARLEQGAGIRAQAMADAPVSAFKTNHLSKFETADAYLARHGMTDSSRVASHFDILLEVEPGEFQRVGP